MLLPFVRAVIGCLLILTLAGLFTGVARIHMAILSFLSAGLLISLSMFESEYRKMQSYSSSGEGEPRKSSSEAATKGSGKQAAPKTD